MRFPNTPTQDWLYRKNACLRGRRWVGRKSLGQAWRECRNASYMRWLLLKMLDQNHADTIDRRLAIDRTISTRDVRALAAQWTDLQIPIGLL